MRQFCPELLTNHLLSAVTYQSYYDEELQMIKISQIFKLQWFILVL